MSVFRCMNSAQFSSLACSASFVYVALSDGADTSVVKVGSGRRRTEAGRVYGVLRGLGACQLVRMAYLPGSGGLIAYWSDALPEGHLRLISGAAMTVDRTLTHAAAASAPLLAAKATAASVRRA